MIFLGCLKISWTDPPVCVCAECPPWAWDAVALDKTVHGQGCCVICMFKDFSKNIQGFINLPLYYPLFICQLLISIVTLVVYEQTCPVSSIFHGPSALKEHNYVKA